MSKKFFLKLREQLEQAFQRVKLWAISCVGFWQSVFQKLTGRTPVTALGNEFALSYRQHPRHFIVSTAAFVAALLILVLFLTASRVNARNFAKIKTGMTPAQVKAVLGSPDDSKTQGGLGLTGTTYVYHYKKTDLRIVFLNDRVMAKQGPF